MCIVCHYYDFHMFFQYLSVNHGNALLSSALPQSVKIAMWARC